MRGFGSSTRTRTLAREGGKNPVADDLEHLARQWEERGAAALDTVRRLDPVAYVRAIAQLLRAE